MNAAPTYGGLAERNSDRGDGAGAVELIGRKHPTTRQDSRVAGSLRVPGHKEVGAWRSLVARLLWEQEVGGSNPSAPTICFQ